MTESKGIYNTKYNFSSQNHYLWHVKKKPGDHTRGIFKNTTKHNQPHTPAAASEQAAQKERTFWYRGRFSSGPYHIPEGHTPRPHGSRQQMRQ